MNAFAKSADNPPDCCVTEPPPYPPPAAGRQARALGGDVLAPGPIRTGTGEAVARMDEQIDRLHISLQRLEERLQAYLTPDFPRETLEKPKAQEQGAAIVEWIHDKRRSLESGNARLEHLITRIQA